MWKISYPLQMVRVLVVFCAKHLFGQKVIFLALGPGPNAPWQRKFLLRHYFIAKLSLKNFRPFYSTSLALSGVKFHDNRQTHKFLTQYAGVVFLMKSAIFLVALLEGDKNVYYVVV